MNLVGKNVLVTGAGRGIGKVCAIDLASEGANVLIVSRTAKELDQVTATVEKQGGSCVSIEFDLSETEKLTEFHKLVESQFGPVDILVNNAGIYKTESVQDENFSEWQETLNLNLSTPNYLSKVFARQMIKKNWGRIVNISSISGQRGEAFGSSYSASKFGLIGITESLAIELAPFGITVNAVCPGWVDTDMAHDQLNSSKWCKLNNIEQSQSEDIARLSVPQKRLLDPQEIAWLVSYLCSHRAKGITGQAINICGGLSVS